MIAIRAERGAALISVMLHLNHAMFIEEEHSVAAASNPYDPSTRFALLETKVKSDMEFASTHTAYQNGISGRFNRTVITIARAMIQ